MYRFPWYLTLVSRLALTMLRATRARALAVLLGVSREPRARPIRGRVADLFCGGRGDFVTLIRLSCQKAVQSRIIFPVG